MGFLTLRAGSTMLQGRPSCDGGDFDVVSPFDRPWCQIFKDVSAIVPQFFSHVTSFVGQFFKDVSTIVHESCQLRQSGLQSFSKRQVQPVTDLFLRHEVG